MAGLITALDIRTVKYPSGLRENYQNGLLPPSLLVSVGPSGVLHPQAARAYKALAFMCMSIGLPLTYTLGGCFRTYDRQEALFRQRYTRAYTIYDPFTGKVKTKTWNGVVWYQMPKTAEAAVPGTSNHGWGLAIDTAFDSFPGDGISPKDAVSITGHPQWARFKEFVTACGFSWELVSEPWHIRYCLGDLTSQLVLDVEKMTQPPDPVPDPVVPPDETEEDEMFKQVIHPGSSTGFAALVVIGGPFPHMTGIGGPATAAHKEALRQCGGGSSVSVERFYYCDMLTKALKGLGTQQVDIDKFLAAVPDGA